jgi:uncharacterized OsmC-like protein/alpha/beta superfamily hydrolase
MGRKAVSFPGNSGMLAGSLELPVGSPRAFALFAHCFTCGMQSSAATRVSRELAAHGVAVLRFDFTGLGGSDGDFGNTDFSSNVADLVAAADFLRTDYRAPSLLIGHSLGGTAVIVAADSIEEARGVATIAAPASPDHVIEQFHADVERIEQDGEAEVTLAGRRFRIQRSFLDDLREVPMPERTRRLRRALLVMHSPVDEVVAIDEAARIFESALHPKSFVSLDRADHLLTDSSAAVYAARVIAAWSAPYLDDEPERESGRVPAGHVRIGELNRRYLREVQTDDHRWLADDPAGAGGDNEGPDPYEHLLAALGACTSMTLRLYANRKRWPLEDVEVALEHTRQHSEDCEDCSDPDRKMDLIRSRIRIDGDLAPEQRARLLEIAERCPVHKTLSGPLRIETEAQR